MDVFVGRCLIFPIPGVRKFLVWAEISDPERIFPDPGDRKLQGSRGSLEGWTVAIPTMVWDVICF